MPASKTTYRRVVSLGTACQTQHQIRRFTGNQGEIRSARRLLGAPTSLFAWQLTPVQALISILKSDFRGAFELSDLEPFETFFQNRLLGTGHVHDFPADTTFDQIPALYAEARVRHDQLCDRTRRMISDSEPTLFVIGVAQLNDGELSEVEQALRAFNPRKKLSLVNIPEILGAHTPGNQPWQGDNAAWKEALAPFAYSDSLALRDIPSGTRRASERVLSRLGRRVRSLMG